MVGPSGSESSPSSINIEMISDTGVGQPEKQSVVPTFVNCDDLNVMDWQSTKCVLNERFEYLFQNELLCDVQFFVGSGANIKKIGAHKLVLSAGSVIFFTMFSEKWSADTGEVEVPDVEPVAFVEMLRFLYSDKIELTFENVSEVLYAAKKYSILALEDKCADFLLSKLCPENAFKCLTQGRMFHVQKLVDASLETIAENTIKCIDTDDFCKIDVETLCLVLERSDLTIHEYSLFKAVLRWSEAACKKEHLPVNPKNQRQVLKNALSLIRFLLMDPAVFESKVVNSGVLSETEILSVMRYFIKKTKPVGCVFSDIPRQTFHVATRFQHIVCRGSYDSSLFVHELSVKVNHPVTLLGIGLYGSPDHSAIYPVDVTLRPYDENEDEDEDEDLVEKMFSGTCNGAKEIFRVMFDSPRPLAANTLYLLQVEIQGKYFRYGCGGLQNVTVNIRANTNVTFTFSSNVSIKTEKDRGTKTDVHSGQIPQIIFDVL